MKCPKCNQKNLNRSGKSSYGTQRWRCYGCGYSYYEPSMKGYAKKRVTSCPFCGNNKTNSKGRDRQRCLNCGKSWKV